MARNIDSQRDDKRKKKKSKRKKRVYAIDIQSSECSDVFLPGEEKKRGSYQRSVVLWRVGGTRVLETRTLL